MTLPLFARKRAKDMVNKFLNGLLSFIRKRKMKIIKEIIESLFNNNRILYVFLCGVFLINILPIPFFGVGTGYTEPIFSITSDNEPLNEVLAEISKSTGYKIEITKGWEDKPLSVNLKKITLEKGLTEIMRIAGEPNYALIINDSMKKVEIRIFDGSSPAQKKSSGIYVGTSSDFRKREKANVERELVDVNMEKAEKPEEPPEIDVIPPEINIRNPD